MWHSVKTVAENHRVDARALADFAKTHHERYHIVSSLTDEPEVNTWNVDALINDFHLVSLRKFAAESKGVKP